MEDLKLNSFPRVQELPSGLIVEVAEWKVSDLSDVATDKTGSGLGKLLTDCIVIEDVNEVYGFEKGQKIQPDRLLIGDRVVLLIHQRIISHSKDFDFDCRCEDRFCGEKIEWSFDLRRLLLPTVPDILDEIEMKKFNEGDHPFKVVKEEDGFAVVWPEKFGDEPILLGDSEIFFKPLSEESIEILKGDGLFTFYVPSLGVDGKFRLFAGRDENKISRDMKRRKKRKELGALFHRIVSIEGVSEKEKEEVICSLKSRDLDSLNENIELYDCGVESVIEIECPTCAESTFVDLPLLDAGFFSPASRKRRSSRGSTSR